MRWLPVVALGLCVAVFPAYAQHGGGGHGGGGGFGGHGSVSGFHGGGGFGARSTGGFGAGPGMGGRAGFAGPRYGGGFGGGRSPYGATRGRPFAPSYAAGGALGARSAFGLRAGGYLGGRGSGYAPYGGRGNRYGYGYGNRFGYRYGYPGFAYPTFVSLGLWDPFLDFADYGSFDGGGSPYSGWDGYAGDAQGAAGAYQAQGYPPEGYQEQGYDGQGYPQASGPAPYATPQDGNGATADAGSDAPLVYAPGVYRQGAVQAPLHPVRQEALVTLYFRDGRPPEQIRNYALTRTSILLPGQTMREIPLSELDLATTERVNQAAGVDFRLP